MQAKTSNAHCFTYCTTVTILCLSLCLLSGTKVQAQETPLIFKSETNTSAISLDYIKSLEKTYTDNVGKNNEEAKQARNRLVFIAVEQTDTVFNSYRRKSRKRNDRLQFLFDFLAIGASTAISLTNGERSRQVIAEALSAFQGTRSAFNKNFRLLELQVLFNKMVANRSKKAIQIYDNLDKDVVQYSWEKARSELKEYLFAGTIDDALNSLNIDTGAEAQPLQRQAEDAKIRAGIVGAPTAQQLAESRKNSDTIGGILESYDNADKQIIETERQITEERASDNPDQAKIDAANQVKNKASAAKTTALENLEAIYLLIEADPALSPLLERIPEKFGKDNPAFKEKLVNSLRRLKEKNAADPPLFGDYARILQNFNGVVIEKLPEDSTLNDRFQRILSTKK